MQIGMKSYIQAHNNELDAKKVRKLLEAIKEYGSLLKASKASGLSYKGAWDLLSRINENSTLVISQTGGKSGGGSALTESGEVLAKNLGTLEKIEELFSQLLPLYITMDQLDKFADKLQKTLYKNRIMVQVEDVESKGEWQYIYATLEGERVRAKVTIHEQFEVGQKVWFVFDVDSVSTKGENLFKGLYAGKEGEWTKIIIEENVLYIDGKYQLKNGLVHFNIKPKNIKVFPCSSD